MTTNYKKVFFGAIVAVAGFAIAIPARAVEYILQGISCIDDGLCTPCDLIDVGVNGAEMILGLSGVFILLFFIYGGLMWMTSYGDSKKVEKGASAIKAAFIGMVIVFVAYSVVELLWQALKVNKPFANSIGCTPLNIQSDGFLGSGDTGGGRGPGTNVRPPLYDEPQGPPLLPGDVPDLPSSDEGVTSEDDAFPNAADWAIVEEYLSGERSNQTIIVNKRVNPPDISRQTASEVVAQGADSAPRDVLESLARNCPAGKRCDFTRNGWRFY